MTVQSDYIGHKSLNSLGLLHETDKASNIHNYLDFYEAYLWQWRYNNTLRVLEIGVEHGNSLRMWRDYFPYAQITGMDINPQCMVHQGERINIIIGDQNNPTDLNQLGDNWDVVVDDGGHRHSAQILSYGVLLPRLNPGGVYILEDYETPEAVHFLANLAHDVVFNQNKSHLGSLIDFIVFNNRGTVLTKRLK